MRDNLGRFLKGNKSNVKGFNDHRIIEEVIEIFINNKIVIADKEDFELINRYRWHIDSHGYATGEDHIAGLRISMARLLVSCPDDMVVDHKNLNILDNRKQNLRIANKKQNAYNSKKRSGCNSRFKGVNFREDRNKWRAYITANKKTTNLGTFDSEIDAAKAYNEAAVRLHGEFAKLNQIN